MRRTSRLLAALLVAAGVLCPAFGAAQTARLAAPSEVVLYVHGELKNSAFVDQLVCDLQRVLTAPVRATRIDFPLTADLLSNPNQLDAAKLGNRFYQLTANDGPPQTFRYLLLPHDMRADPWRFVFSLSFGGPPPAPRFGVVSAARLDGGGPALTAARAYKLILKSVARVAGYVSPDRCVLSFPRTLEELDAKSAEFCAEDRAALVAAGLLKRGEGGGCVPIV